MRVEEGGLEILKLGGERHVMNPGEGRRHGM